MSELFRASSLHHRFPDGTFGIREVNVTIEEGEFVLIAGRNGAGKSLLVRHFVGLSAPTSGEVFYRGTPVAKTIPQIRREVGYVFQDTEAQIFGQTVREDLAFGPANLGIKGKELEDAIDAALRDARMTGMAERRPLTLSGGEKRRLAIAGVLAMRPRCVILDEPFVNLDLPSVQEILGVLSTLHKEGVTLLVLTHEIEKVVALTSRLIILDAGRIAFDAPFQDATKSIFATHGLVCPYRECYPWQID